MDNRGIVARFQVEAKIFLYSKSSRRALVPTSLQFVGHRKLFYRG